VRILAIAIVVLGTVLVSSGLATITNVSTSLDGNKLDLTSIEISQPNLGLDRVMAYSQLVMPRLTDYHSIPENGTANVVTIFGTPDNPPPEGSDRLALISDAALNTGIFNPSTTGPGLTLAFDTPLINGPGTDVVVFELTIGSETPDPFTLSQTSGAGTAKSVASGSYGIHGAISAEAAPATWLAAVGDGGSAGMPELLGPTTTAGITVNPQWWAVGVDLTSLGVSDWGRVNSLLLVSKDGTHAIDPLMIAGLPPATAAGDFDANGVVDAADYNLWRSQFGTVSASIGDGADGNGDGVIDAADYVVWRHAMGGGASTSAAVVPEPSTLVFVVIATCIFLASVSESNSFVARRGL
jgi:hypothetical protein